MFCFYKKCYYGTGKNVIIKFIEVKMLVQFSKIGIMVLIKTCMIIVV